MSKKDKKKDPTLFERALEWYDSGDYGKQQAALELFSEKQLKDAVEEHRKKKKREEIKDRDIELQEKLERCKKMFPLGILIWSDDGTDVYPNVVVSEPYIGTSDWHRYIHGSVLNNDNRTILVETVRICMDGPWWPKTKHLVCLENILHYMDLPNDNKFKKNHIINLPEFYEKAEKERQSQITRYNELIAGYQKQIDSCTKTLKEYEDYNPKVVTEEYAQEILAEYQKRYK